MHVHVLGPLEVGLDDGSAVDVRAPKLQALLVALALDAGRTVSSERLVDAIWGQTPPERALAALRSYVSNLRRLLRQEAGRVVSGGRGYLLDVPSEAVDAFAFERLAAEGRRAWREGDPATAVDLLGRALALWRGPALADVGDREFARPLATRLEELRVTAAEDRLEALWLSGHHEHVVAEVEPLLADHPLRERPVRLLMLALHAAGRTPDALAAHHRFRARLAEELGLDPSPELEQLAERVLRQDPGLVPPRPGGGPQGAGSPASTAPPDLVGGPLLVGREREQEQLARALERTATGAGSVVLLSGEPGIGKSALLHELVHRATRRGMATAWGRCVATGGAPAFWPWTQVIRAVVGSLDDDALQAATAGPASAVGHLVPEVVERTGRAAAIVAGEGPAARFVLHDAVTTFLCRAAAPDGLVVLVDDLHWGDPASCELAAFLGSHLAHVPLVLAISHRSVAADRTAELDAATSALLREPTTVALELAGLSEEAVAELVTGVLGRAPTGVDVTQLHARANGNPFFVHQLVQLLVDTDASPTDEPDLPHGLRQVLLHRLDRLPARSRETLEVAAILGRDIDPVVVARCVERPAAEVVDDLDAAIAHGLVTSPAAGTGHRFAHALVRETIDRELPAGRALRWHLAAADALERLPRPPTDAIAEHLWQASSLVDVDRAVDWLCRAADEAVGVFAHEQATRSLQRALRLLLTTTSPSPALELTVRLRLVQVLTAVHGWTSEEVGHVVVRARELAGEAGIGGERLSLWWSLWTLSTTRGDLEDGRALAHQLLDDALRLGLPESLVAGHVAVAYIEMTTGAPPARVHAHLDEAQTAEAAADPAALGATPEHLSVALRVTRGMAHALEGDRDAASTHMAAAVAVAEGLASPFAEAYARMFAAWAAAILDDRESSWEHADAGTTVCEDAGLPALATLLTPTHAWSAAHRGGDPCAAAARIRDATDGLASVGHRHALALWTVLLADVLALAGDARGARATAQRARALSTEIGERLDGPLVRRVEAL